MNREGGMRKRNRLVMATVVMFLVAMLISWNWQLLTILWSTPLWHQSPLPEFDASKAKSLGTRAERNWSGSCSVSCGFGTRKAADIRNRAHWRSAGSAGWKWRTRATNWPI